MVCPRQAEAQLIAGLVEYWLPDTMRIAQGAGAADTAVGMPRAQMLGGQLMTTEGRREYKLCALAMCAPGGEAAGGSRGVHLTPRPWASVTEAPILKAHAHSNPPQPSFQLEHSAGPPTRFAENPC